MRIESESAPWIVRTTRAAALLWLALVALLVGCGHASPEPAAMPTATPAAPVAAEAAESEQAEEPAPDPAWKRAFLWRIEGKRPSYVLGTIHIPDERLGIAPDAVVDALNEVEAVITEAPMDQVDDAKALAAKLMLPKGQTLDRLLPKEVAARAQQVFNARGMPWERVSVLKPWVLVVQLAAGQYMNRVDEEGNPIPSLDKRLFNFAVSKGKERGGLETVDEQLAVLDGWTMQEQARWLSHELDDVEGGAKKTAETFDAMLAAFFVGDDAGLNALVRKGFDPKSPADARLLKRIYTDRNVVMADRIAKKIRTGKPSLFAIGAGHVVGDGNVITLLRKRGLTVSRVEEPTTAAREGAGEK